MSRSLSASDTSVEREMQMGAKDLEVSTPSPAATTVGRTCVYFRVEDEGRTNARELN